MRRTGWPASASARFTCADREVAEVEDARGEHGVGPGVDRGSEVLEASGTAARDDRDGHLGPHRADQREVVAVLRAVRVHRVQQDLPRPEAGRADGPLERVDAGGAATAVRRDLPPGGRDDAVRAAPGVDRQDDALRAEPLRRLAQQLGPGDRRGVHADLVGSGPQQPVDVVGLAHAATDRERDEDLLRRTPDDVVRRLAVAAARRDVEEHELVGALGVVGAGQLDRVARVAQVGEVDALDHATGVDVETRDHPDRNWHATSLRRARRRAAPAVPT